MPQQAEQAAAAQPRATDRMPQLTSLAPTQQIEQTAAVPLCATGHMPQQTEPAAAAQPRATGRTPQQTSLQPEAAVPPMVPSGAQ